MLTKSNRTIDVYKNAGAAARLCKAVMATAVADLSDVLDARERERLCRAQMMLSLACDEANMRMFNDFPDMDLNHLDIFYGALIGEPISNIDTEIRELARLRAADLFKDPGSAGG